MKSAAVPLIIAYNNINLGRVRPDSNYDRLGIPLCVGLTVAGRVQTEDGCVVSGGIFADRVAKQGVMLAIG